MNQSSIFKPFSNFQTDIHPLVIPQQDQYQFQNTGNQVLSQQLLIDSASRNWNVDDTNKYTVFLGEELKYVHSIELIDGHIPNSSYMITKQNNLFYFQETYSQANTDTYYTAKIPTGNYTITDLLNQLKISMQVASGSASQYMCQVNHSKSRVTISSDDGVGTGIFNLILTDCNEIVGDRGYMETQVIDPITGRKQIQRVETGNARNRYIQSSLGQTLGFKAQNLGGALTYTGQMVYKLRLNDYIALYIRTENNDNFDNVIAPSPDDGADNAYAIINLDHNGEYFDIFADRHQVSDNAKYLKKFNPPINFSKITVEFKTPNGQLYDFNGLDNHLIFDIKQVYNREAINKFGNLTE